MFAYDTAAYPSGAYLDAFETLSDADLRTLLPAAVPPLPRPPRATLPHGIPPVYHQPHNQKDHCND